MGPAQALPDCYMPLPAVWEMYTSERLFDEHVSIGQVFYMIAYEGWRPQIPEGCPIGYAELMAACWAHNPEQRPTAGDVLGQLNKLYAAEKQRYQQEKLAEQQRAAAEAAAALAAAEASGKHAFTQQQQQQQQQGSGAEAGGKAALAEIAALDAGQGGQQVFGIEGCYLRDPHQHQRQQQGWQPPQLRPSPFDQPAMTQSVTPFGGGVMAGSMFSDVAAAAGGATGTALEGRNSLDGGYGDNATQESCVISTCCVDTMTGSPAGGTLGSPAPGELDMVEGWGSATKSSRESSDKTETSGGTPQQQGSRGTPLGSAVEGGVPIHLELYREESRGTPGSSTAAGAVPVHVEPVDSKAAAGKMLSAESAAVWYAQIPRKEQNPRSRESVLAATESVDTGTLPPTMASLATMQLTSDDVRSMRLSDCY